MANRSFSGRRSLLFSLTFLTILFWFFPLLTHGAELEDLGAYLRVTTANESSSLNSLTRMITSTADVTLTNISEKTFTVPLHAVINISVAGVQMPEALGGVGIAPYEKYYYDLSGQIPGGVMPPGGSVTFRAVFVRYYTVRFTYTVSPYGLPASSTAPQIQISPTSVDFGEVAIGASAVQEITVSNPGDAVLSVASIQGSGSPFMLYPPTSFDLAPGGSQQVHVGFSPETEDSFTGSIGIASNAPGQEETTVSVSGRGIVPIGQPAISAPTTVEFGAVMEGQSATKDVTVCSTGTAPLSITQANLDNSEFSWAPNGAPSLPLSLAGGECLNLPIAFTPGMGSGGFTREGNLTIASDAGNAGVRLSGSAVTPVDLQTLSVLDARVINGAVYDQIDETTCSTVEGEVRFGEGSRSSDSFVVTITDQTGISVSSSPFEATQGAGTAIFSGIDACDLKDGMVTVTVSLGDDDQNTMTGTPAAKNTSDLAAPILDPIDPATVFSTIKVCGEAPANTLVQINGGSGTVDLQLTNGQTGFCLDVPLRPNTENLLVASATDPARGLVASAAPVKVNQVDPSSVAIAQASSRPLTVEEVETLVEKGVIDLNDPANFNVSMFTIGLNIGGSSFIISQPVVVNSTAGTVSYGVGTGWVGSGYPTTYTAGSAMQVVVIRTPSGQTIPGVIIIDGRIKTLKEFFQVTIAIQNTTTLFDLTDMVASISLPAGLSPVKAGPGTDVSSINTGSATDTVAIGAIGPQQTGTGQFIIRGDGIGTHNVTVNFQGFLSGGGLAENFPISGSANTSVQVFGPPKLDVVVRHPGDPDSAEPDVTAGEIYTLTVDVTNRSPIPALYASLQLLIGQGAVLVDGDGNEVLGSSTVRNLGHIQPGQTASQAFRVKSKLTGKILACQALASENINLTVDIGGGDCSIANTIPANFQFPPANAPPAIMAINPLNNQPNLPLSTTIMAILTPQAGCLTADTWTNVVTDWIDPNNHDKGVRIVSAELATIGAFYLEELDRFGNPVAHVPVDLTVTAGVDGQTSIAVLRPGLASPLSQSLLKPNTFYRATLVGGDDGICNAGLNSVTLANSFRWTFSTEQTCGVDAPTATLDQPLNGSTGQPLNQNILLNFGRRMDPTSFTFDPATPANSSFLVVAGGTVSGGDISGGTIVPGTAAFSNLFQSLTFTPNGNLPEGETIYVRLKNTIKDICDNPLQTPDGGILLFSFTTSPPDTTPPDPPAVNPVALLTNQSVIQVSGSAEPGSVVTITGGATTATVTTSSSGLFIASVQLVTNAGNTLQVTAADASNNVSAPIEVDKNGAALTVVHDSVPPSVTSVDPANGATNVANNAAIHVTFSKAINPGTVNSLNFKVEGTAPVIGSFTLVGDNGFTFTPTAPLESGQTYIVRLRAGGIADTAGNSLMSEHTSLFVIEDDEASTLTTVAPASGAQGTTFDVTFTGTNLATAGAVFSDNPGVSGTITGKTDTSVTAGIIIAPSTTAGTTTLGLVTSGGTVKLPFTVTTAGTISLANFEVGKNMQVNPVVIFTPAPAAGTVVSITSSDAAKLLLSTSPTVAGSGSLSYTMAGGAAIGDLQAQALAGSGAATVTVSAPGYASATATATLRPSGFVITTSDFNTVVGDADTTVTVAARMLNEAMAPTAAGQVRGGIGINVPVTSSDPTVGTIVVNPVTLAGGSSTAATSFHPLAGGSTVISLAPPEGFGTPTSGQGIAATVVGKVITLTAPTTSLVTRNRYPFTVGLAAPAGPGGQPVELAVTTGDMVTIPATVTVPEGKTSVNFDVETALATGTLTLTASAPGFTGDSKALIVAARTFSLYSPLVGIDRTVAARITLDQPAPSGGATFVLSVANPNVATVSPVNLTISAGETIGDFELTGGLTVGLTTLTADGTGSGYISKTLNITATNRLIDVPSGKEVELGTSHVVPVLIAPDPAPAGGVTLTVTSSDPTIVEVLTPTIVIPEGSYQGTIEIRAASGTTGTAVITAANAGFAPDTMQVSLTAGLDILESFANISSTTTGELLLRLVSGGRTYPAAAGGVEIVLSSSDSACVAPPSALTIAEGTSFGTATVGYGGTASLPCTTTVTASNPLFGTDTAQVTIDQSQDLGGITITQLENSSNRIGAGLQSPYRLTLATGNHGGVKVQLKSSDPAVARLSASATNFGLPLIELAIPDGQTSVTFYVQGVRETTGSVTLTAQSPRFITKTASLAVVEPVFLLTDLTSPTTSLAADDAFYVHTGVLNATGTSFSQYQNVSAQGSLPATFTSSDPAVGQLAKAYERGASVTVNIPVDRHTSPTTVATGGVAFDALADGTTTVTATAPGFDSAWSGAAKVVTVNQPIMIIPDATGIGHRVGASLQVQYHIDLGTIATNHGGVTVHVESSDSGKVRLSNSATTAGSAAIDVPIADGERYGYFYVQGVRGTTGTAVLTATHTLFATATATINVVQPVIEIIGLNVSTTPLATDDDFYVNLRVLNAAGTVSYTQNVSGEGPLPVTFTSSDPTVGQMVKTGERGASITIDIPAGRYYSSQTGIVNGGVAFDALAGGTTTVAATAPGFNSGWSDAAKVVTVNAPAMTIPAPYGIGHRVGASLQLQYSIDLGGTSHGGVTVHVESGDSGKVRLSNSATTAGTAAVDVPIAAGQRYGYFYVQGVRGTTGTAVLTATQSLFATATATINVVQPVMQINGLNTSTTPLAADDDFYVNLYVSNAAGTMYSQSVSGDGPLPITFTSGDPVVGQLAKTGERGASVTVNIQVNQDNSPTTLATGGVAFDALAGGTATVAATAPGFNNEYSQASKVVTVNPSALTIADTTGIGNRVGASLQVQYRIDLGGTSHGGVTVHVESGDSGKVQLSNSATTAGAAAIDVPIADGERYGYFYVQGVRSTTGTAILTATHPLFATATASINVVQPVMYISSLNTSTNPLAADDDFYVYLRVVNAAGTRVYSQNVSGEGPLPVTFTSSDPIVGLLAKTGERGASVTVNIPVNQDSTPTTLASGGVAYDALSSGITTVAATAPGFNNAYSQASQAVTVKPLAITITDVDNDTFRVGGGLQTRYRVTLNTSTHGGVTVRVASGDTTRVLLAPDAVTPGTSFIDLFIANGQTTKDFYVRGVAGATGTVTLTATSPLFTTGSAAVEVVRTAVRIADVETVTYRVGGGLQNRYRLTLEDPAYGGVTVRVASSDTTRALLAPDAVTSGTSFVDLVFADGQTTKDFHVQGINGVTGMITITATSPIFNSGTAAVEVVRSAIRIEGLNTSMTASAANDPFYVSSGILDAVGISFAKTQTVSPAGPLQVLLTSGTPSVGQLLTNVAGGAQVTVSVPANSSASPGTKATGGVEFDPLTGGSTTVSATVNGFNNDWSGARTGITVTP